MSSKKILVRNVQTFLSSNNIEQPVVAMYLFSDTTRAIGGAGAVGISLEIVGGGLGSVANHIVVASVATKVALAGTILLDGGLTIVCVTLVGVAYMALTDKKRSTHEELDDLYQKIKDYISCEHYEKVAKFKLVIDGMISFVNQYSNINLEPDADQKAVVCIFLSLTICPGGNIFIEKPVRHEDRVWDISSLPADLQEEASELDGARKKLINCAQKIIQIMPSLYPDLSNRAADDDSTDDEGAFSGDDNDDEVAALMGAVSHSSFLGGRSLELTNRGGGGPSSDGSGDSMAANR